MVSSRIARNGSRLLSRVLDVPPPTTDYRVSRVVTLMRDGVELVGNHYAPTGTAKGTLLVRCPYGRRFPFGPVFGAAYARRGYHVLLQSVRGTFGSGGEFDPMVNEIADAVDTAAWLRDQPWFTGSFATMGLSYLGFTQWALLTDPPPELKAAIISVGPHDFAESTWGTGAFKLNDFLGWSDMMAHQEEARLAVGVRQFRSPRLVARTADQAPAGPAARRLLGSGATWYESWISHPDRADPFWENMALADTLDKVDVPVLLFGGWQDLFLDQTLTQFQRLHDRGVPTAVTIGSWTHTQLLTRGGATVLRESLAWLDTHLAETPAPDRAAVRVEVNGQGWLTMPDWPPAATELELYLQPAHRLSTAAPDDTAPPSRFTFDPAEPTPTVGGRLLSSAAGYTEDSALSRRPDVVDFTGAPLAEDLYLIGNPVIELALSCDNPNRDVFVRLSEVDVQGRSRNVSDGFRRLTTPLGDPETVRLELDAVAHRIPAGSRLRVVVAGGCHPRYDRNLGTGEPVVSGECMVPATHTVHHGAGGMSRLLLPMVALSAD
ncbi:CocE/NonD family hydrolase [Mycolicibacterium sp. CBMA 311]|uniref:CocE/NonD family hydrolase n=1 Tax=unclassified Mycolicibacterium TaxID=2636767 RepID=UPI0035CCCB3A